MVLLDLQMLEPARDCDGGGEAQSAISVSLCNVANSGLSVTLCL
ncbi:SapB/AmfS family lanthipeptide [Streptomyces sp. NPDC052020]